MLQVRPDGVWRNTRSPSVYIGLPASPDKTAADPAAAPRWQRLSDRPVVRWHDHRAVWHGSPPAQVRADPTRRHRVAACLPPPDAATWCAAVLFAAAAVGSLGLVRTRRRATPRRRFARHWR
jgi:hypothetical protein